MNVNTLSLLLNELLRCVKYYADKKHIRIDHFHYPQVADKGEVARDTLKKCDEIIKVTKLKL